jgi:hypothetical protein
MSDSKGDYYEDDFGEKEPELKPEPRKFEPGDRVTLRRAYRSRGVATKGGWSYQFRTGTVISSTTKNVVVKMDIPEPIDYVMRSSIVVHMPIDRAHLIPPPDNAG